MEGEVFELIIFINYATNYHYVVYRCAMLVIQCTRLPLQEDMVTVTHTDLRKAGPSPMKLVDCFPSPSHPKLLFNTNFVIGCPNL